MNPHQKNKVDVNSLSPEEQRLFRLYGKLPSRSDHFAKHLKERKYFDSGDYAMSKAGKGDGVDTGTVGSQHPVPEMIPHLSSPPPAGAGGGGSNGHSHTIGGGSSNGNGGAGSGIGIGAGSGITLGVPGAGAHHPFQQAGSPVKESSFLYRETSAADLEDGDGDGPAAAPPKQAAAAASASSSSPVGQGQTESIPIRR